MRSVLLRRAHRQLGCSDDLSAQYAREIYEDHSDDSESAGHKEQEPAGKLDIEQEISQEVTGIKEARKGALFVPVKVDIQCGNKLSGLSAAPWLTG